MGVLQMDLFGELIIRIVFFVCLGLFIVRPLKPTHMERNLYFGTLMAFIFSKWFIIFASNPSHEEMKNFFLGLGVFGNIVGYFTLIVFVQSIFNIKNHYKNSDLPTK